MNRGTSLDSALETGTRPGTWNLEPENRGTSLIDDGLRT
jgi:hypothetical protein